jgi:hypothetical protein
MSYILHIMGTGRQEVRHLPHSLWTFLEKPSTLEKKGLVPNINIKNEKYF